MSPPYKLQWKHQVKSAIHFTGPVNWNWKQKKSHL
jgi:hypothetical protein